MYMLHLPNKELPIVTILLTLNVQVLYVKMGQWMGNGVRFSNIIYIQEKVMKFAYVYSNATALPLCNSQPNWQPHLCKIDLLAT